MGAGRFRERCRHFAWLFTTHRPFAYLYQGWCDWLAGRRRRARHPWHNSLATAQQLALPYIEGAAHYHIGRHLPLDDPQRQTHLTRAVENFEKLETNYDLGKRELLRRQQRMGEWNGLFAY